MRGARPYTCAVNIEEVARGLRREEQRGFDRLLSWLRVVPLGKQEGELAGRWRREFAARGVTLSQADCLVAAAAMRIDARLLTGNPKDFPMAEVSVEHWPVGG